MIPALSLKARAALRVASGQCATIADAEKVLAHEALVLQQAQAFFNEKAQSLADRFGNLRVNLEDENCPVTLALAEALAQAEAIRTRPL